MMHIQTYFDMDLFPIPWFRYRETIHTDVLSTRPLVYAKTLACHSALHSTNHIASIEYGSGTELSQFSPTDIGLIFVENY